MSKLSATKISKQILQLKQNINDNTNYDDFLAILLKILDEIKYEGYLTSNQYNSVVEKLQKSGNPIRNDKHSDRNSNRNDCKYAKAEAYFGFIDKLKEELKDKDFTNPIMAAFFGLISNVSISVSPFLVIGGIVFGSATAITVGIASLAIGVLSLVAASYLSYQFIQNDIKNSDLSFELGALQNSSMNNHLFMKDNKTRELGSEETHHVKKHAFAWSLNTEHSHPTTSLFSFGTAKTLSHMSRNSCMNNNRFPRTYKVGFM